MGQCRLARSLIAIRIEYNVQFISDQSSVKLLFIMLFKINIVHSNIIKKKISIKYAIKLNNQN